jgi:hypothetical protein
VALGAMAMGGVLEVFVGLFEFFAHDGGRVRLLILPCAGESGCFRRSAFTLWKGAE